ncbi:MAG: hypothetical protein JJT87_02510 [Halomonas sp.]|nr:hypothetical protein [Halomonas sp.]MCC5900789.1 hypothetical protein [Halomonas sp.]
MTIDVAEIEVGAVYRTETDQLRRVEKVESDDEGRNRVYYKAKSARIPNRPFDIAHTLDNPPLDESFAEACSHRLSDEEIRELVIEGVLTREKLDG